jgi:RNA polymerase sigma-70 factor (ECF subfamily)
MPDDDLLTRVRAGEAEALGQYIEQQRAPLLAIIRRKMSGGLLSKVETEDILQEVCTTAMQSLASVDFGDRDPFVWICHLIDRRIVDAHRRFHARKRAATQEVRIAPGEHSQGGIVDLLIASVTSPSMALSRKQKESRLWKALRQLPDEQQRAMTMRYVQNLPSKDIAQQLGKSDGAVRVMLTRATKRLEQLMCEPG